MQSNSNDALMALLAKLQQSKSWPEALDKMFGRQGWPAMPGEYNAGQGRMDPGLLSPPGSGSSPDYMPASLKTTGGK